jgi:hypothetical protein
MVGSSTSSLSSVLSIICSVSAADDLKSKRSSIEFRVEKSAVVAAYSSLTSHVLLSSFTSQSNCTNCSLVLISASSPEILTS